jgi:Cft2 family RNA processing exonuclease
MEIIDLNRDGGIGANSFFLRIGDVNLLLDCGLHPKKTGRGATPDLSPLRGHRLDLIVITHCHLDHIGSLPVAMREHPGVPVLMSTSSRMLIERMLHNSANVMVRQRDDENIPGYPLFTHEEIDRCARLFTGQPFNAPRRLRGARDEIEIIFHAAGHVAGAAGVEIRHKQRAIFFTGDVMFDHQRIQKGAAFPKGRFDTLVMETTRGATERPPGKTRAAEMARLADSINTTIQRGGSFLIPAFALGRMQEMLAVVYDARRFRRIVDCPIFASGLGMDLVDYFDEIARKTRHLQFTRALVKELKVRPLPRQIKAGEDPGQNALYIVSSGMLVERTPSYMLASGLVGHARNTVGFVGYCDPDTPGGHLLAAEHGAPFEFKAAHVRTRVRAAVERFELSGHADREELVDFAVKTGARSIVLTHGDPPARAWVAGQLAVRMPEAKVLDPKPLKSYRV